MKEPWDSQYCQYPGDCRTIEQKNDDVEFADKFATRGTVKHFALRLGFAPHNEEEAEIILYKTIMGMYDQ